MTIAVTEPAPTVLQASCRFCRAPLRTTVADLGVQPLANAFLKAAELQRMEPFYPLRVYVCEACFLVQLEEFVCPENIFTDYPYFSSYSESWLRHARAYADMIVTRFGLTPRSFVVEIGSNDGYLLQYFAEKGVPALGIEPAVNVAEAAIRRGVQTLVGFFDRGMAEQLVKQGRQADLIVGNNVLAQVPDLNDFVSGMKGLLGREGLITMEFPHLMQLIALNQFDTVYHEHFSYFSLVSVEKIFAAHGLTVFDVEELPTHGGSLRIYARHAENASKPVADRVQALRAREEAAGLTQVQYYRGFDEAVKRTKRRLLEFLIRAREQGKVVVGYGAPAKGNTLLNYCGIRSDLIDYTVDLNPHKQGQFLPGTRIPVFDPKRVRVTKPDYLLILPWNLSDEIIEQMSYIREWGGRFLVPIPEVRVY